MPVVRDRVNPDLDQHHALSRELQGWSRGDHAGVRMAMLAHQRAGEVERLLGGDRDQDALLAKLAAQLGGEVLREHATERAPLRPAQRPRGWCV